MLLTDRLVRIECDKKDKKCIHDYTLKGYEVQFEDGVTFFDISVKDVPPTSRKAMVTIRCDYCGVEYQTNMYNYNRTRTDGHTDSCGSVGCNNKKRIDTNIAKYGIAKIPRIMNSIKIIVNDIETDGYKCAVCGHEKPLTDFPSDSRSTIGITVRCKECAKNSAFAVHRRAYQSDYQKDYAERKKEERKVYRAEWWKKRQLEKKG